ncbi:Callose synthase 12 [Spatholobus suberectus]|nr:Callose synthase 12 [Spatholobus suberectus]
MASAPSVRGSGGSKGFDFGSDDILCSYEEDRTSHDSSNATHIDPTKDSHVSRMARTSIVPATAYSLPLDSLGQDVIATVEKSMKTYADNLMRFLEGISSRLSQLELYCYNLDKSIGAMRSDLNNDHEEADSKLKSLDKHLQEVHRSLQILRDKQELAETQKELAKLQLVRKESSSPSHPQSNEERSSPSSMDPKRIDNASDTQNQELALALPRQVAPWVASSYQAPAPNVSQATQQPRYYIMPTPLPNPQVVAQLPQNQYLPSDPQYRIPQSTSSSQVTQSPPVQQFSQYQQLQHQQQQWPQQLPQQVQPPQPPSTQSQMRPPLTNVYTPYSTSQATNPLPTETQPPQPPPMQSQMRPRLTNVYTPYSTSQATNPLPTETVPNSMPMQMPYSGIPSRVSSRGDAIPYGYGGAGRTVPQQPLPQQKRGSFSAQRGVCKTNPPQIQNQNLVANTSRNQRGVLYCSALFWIPTPHDMPITRRHHDYDVIEPYNIIPLHTPIADHPSLRFPEVRAAAAALRSVGDLRLPPQWQPGMDLLDWLALFFGFQNDNVRNQREHLVLHLANAQMRLSTPPDALDAAVLRSFRTKLLRNYTAWCSHLAAKPSVRLSDRPDSSSDHRRELLYVSLYLLVWGEAANLRFLPECISFIFHHMATDLNKILQDHDSTLHAPSLHEENAFLERVVKPIYRTLLSEVESSRNGTAPHCQWRNYDDVNEFFWSKRCFKKLKWPLDVGSEFFSKRVGKTGFVERRSFWNLFRSFDRLWVMLVLFLQAGVIVAWEDRAYPWHALEERDVQIRVLTVFFTWSAMRFLRSLLDIVMQCRLVSVETIGLGVRMVLKTIVAAGWFLVFFVFYWKIWEQRIRDGKWSVEANKRLLNFLEVAFAFVIPELLDLVLFVLPWVRNFIETRDWRVFHVLSWWFQSRTFVGRGLREGLLDNIRYTLFWVVVLASKFCFSYFLQIRPMVAPSRAVLDLKDVNYKWHEFFQNGNGFALGLLWIPVVLIYLMDIQIWYSIYSSLVGASVGLIAHLGEIRSMQQLKLRFQFLASAVLFNLMPEEQLLNARGTLSSKVKDAVRRMKLRYGFGQPYMKLESNQSEANKFALIWNEIIMCFREEDIISDREVELLELPKSCWNVRVIRWPCFLLCNELLLALSQAKELVDASDKRLWRKICKHEFRRCAVIETYDCIKHLLLEIIKPNSEEHSIVMVLFQEIDHSLEIGKFTKVFKTTALPQLHNKLLKLVGLLNRKNIDTNQLVNTLQALYEIVIRDFFKEKRNTEQLRENGLAPQNLASSEVLLFENGIQLPETINENFYRQIRRLHTILTSRDSMQNIPVNLQARRRIAFFTNSLFMNMPHAPQVEKMMAFSVLTPYYSEEVVYSKEQLRVGNEDGVSTLYYLQTIYNDEWKNFMERMRREGMKNDSEIWTDKLRDLRSWASYRGQTLSRTVRGMMYYYKALKLLAFLDSASETEIREGTRELVFLKQDNADYFSSERSPSPMSLSRASSSASLLFKGHDYGTASMKFTYVIACQIYGAQKARKDPHADEILYLMKNNEAVRVAYVDEVPTGRDEKEHYSVLVKYDQQLDKEVEIYRVKLPGPIKLGEGKPENQNHAIIFTRGDAVQTIDMNQDSYFEEALKMRNLLEEYRHRYGIRKPTILGVREHIFTGSVSSLAWFMSAQESSFVTLGQRVLANPLKVRMHYGHPDVFDRFWFITRGGLSKASRVINISEDIFAGFNCTLRGGNVTHHEYIQVGKGRDVGLNQISMFEAKVASGNGEQVLSRDVYRLGHRLDFLRMLSFFYTTVGFFFNTMMVVLTVYAFLWGRLLLALSGIEAAMESNSNNNKALGIILNQQFIVQIGLFTALPMIVENSLEHGFLQAVWDFLTMQLQLSSVFYTFSMGTRSHFFGRTILHGGAKYRATGRGFVVEHKSFAENYRLYARSHFVKAIELGLILIIYASHSTVATDTFVYIAMTISSWFLVVSWIMAPFVFNPSGFDWLKTVYDFDDFMNWIWHRQRVFAKAEQSWEKWWYEEQDHLKVTGFWGKLLEVILDLRFFIFQYGIVYQLGIAAGRTSIAVYLLSWIYVFVVFGIYVAVAYARNECEAKHHIYYRLVQSMVIVVAILVIVALMKFTEFKFMDIFTSLLAFIPTGWGMILVAQVFRPFLQCTVIWNVVVSLARLYDILFGVIVLAPVALLSWLPGFQPMQTRILFNEAFSRGLRIFQIVTGKKSIGNCD